MNYEFSSIDVLLFIGVFALVVVVFILGFKYILSNKKDLKQKYAEAKLKSPHLARYKYPEVDVFKFRRPILLFGVLLSIAIVFVVFNWTVVNQKIDFSKYNLSVEDDEMVIIPRTILKDKKKPKPVEALEVIIEDDIEDDTIEFLSTEVGVDESIEIPEEDSMLVTEAPMPPPRKEEADPIMIVVEDMPRFPGCENEKNKIEKEKCAYQKLYGYIYSNLAYPPIARESGIEGKVTLRFAVDKTGQISKIKILRDIGGGCGKAAFKAIESMKSLKWIPGRQGGRKVSVWFTLPVVFKLTG